MRHIFLILFTICIISSAGTTEPAGMNATYEDALSYHESLIVNLDHEVGISFDEYGNVILYKVGEAHQVWFTHDELDRMNGTVYTHNHPGGRTFSPQDLRFMCRIQAKEMRAVSTEHTYIFRMSDGSCFPRYMWYTCINESFQYNRNNASGWGNLWTTVANDIDGLEYLVI